MTSIAIARKRTSTLVTVRARSSMGMTDGLPLATPSSPQESGSSSSSGCAWLQWIKGKDLRQFAKVDGGIDIVTCGTMLQWPKDPSEGTAIDLSTHG